MVNTFKMMANPTMNANISLQSTPILCAPVSGYGIRIYGSSYSRTGNIDMDSAI